MSAEITNEKITKDENFQRSAQAPVGMVAVVSMNTIWKRNIAAMPDVKVESGWSMNPVMPNRPNGCPRTSIVNSFARIASPPKMAPTPPICRPKPTKKKPMMPMA